MPPTEAFLTTPKLPVLFAVAKVNSSVTAKVPVIEALLFTPKVPPTETF